MVMKRYIVYLQLPKKAKHVVKTNINGFNSNSINQSSLDSGYIGKQQVILPSSGLGLVQQ